MKSYRWTLAQCGWCPYEKRRSGHRHIPRDNHVMAWGGDGHLHAKERGPWRHWACRHFDLGLPASRLWDDKCVLFKPPTAWSYIMKAQADLDQAVLSVEDAQVAVLRPLPSQYWSLTPQLLSVNDGDEPSPALGPLGACPQPKGAASSKDTVLF